MSIDLEEKRKELKQFEKRMDRGGAIIAAGFAFFIPILVLVFTSLYLSRPLALFDLLFWGIPGIIIVIIGFIIFGDAFSEAKRIKEENPLLIESETKLKNR